jgi:hypothetical protein
VVPTVVDADGGVAGTVTTTDSRPPGRDVVSAQQGGVEVASTAVDEVGGYVLALPDGTYDLVAIAPGYAYASLAGVGSRRAPRAPRTSPSRRRRSARSTGASRPRATT